MRTKPCIKCGISKPATPEYFYRHKKMKDGLFNKCKLCAREDSRAYEKADPEKCAKRHREYYQNNKVSLTEKSKQWRLNNAEKDKASRKKWKQDNREKTNRMNRERYPENAERLSRNRHRYWHKHKESILSRLKEKRRKDIEGYREKTRFRTMRRYALKLGAKGSHTLEEYLKVIADYEWKCAYCGKTLTRSMVTKDHVVPLSRGGSDDISNIVTACFPCNLSKGAKSLDDWIMWKKTVVNQ